MSREAKITLLLSGLFTIAMGLSNVFVSIFIWKATNDYSTITLYHLMQFTFMPLTLVFSGWLSKKFNGIWALRIGIGLFIIFFLLILVTRQSISKVIIPFGILFGIASGFYWLAIQLLAFDYTCINNRDTYNGYNGFICSAVGAISPLAAAFVIDLLENNTGYYVIFFISLLFFVAQIIVSLFLKPENLGEKLVFNKLIVGVGDEWKNIQKALIAWGLRNGVIIFVIQILIFSNTGSELSLGKITFVGSILCSLFFLVQQKIIKPKHRVLSLTIGCTFMFISVFPLFFKINSSILILHTLVNSIFVPFFLVPLSSMTFNALERNNEQHFRTEYIINKEIMLHIGRITSTLILFLLLKFLKNKDIINYYLFFLGSVQFIALYFLRKIKTWDQ